jgi:hypothetical protein
MVPHTTGSEITITENGLVVMGTENAALDSGARVWVDERAYLRCNPDLSRSGLPRSVSVWPSPLKRMASVRIGGSAANRRPQKSASNPVAAFTMGMVLSDSY